ncbi:hypothetical protein Pmani_017817 [Petrolisthes manimaculis]|uniref:tRNA-binding domain-containing protein n=1 Tax=Petrolisthes manimaculis TaxID=1843537 RepID=A0AAE1PLN3_9EUCA|nr:hypothetical protein Pmani_017817 [Petrolisthes manimaculis]
MGITGCSAINCSNNSKWNRDLSFFRFPKDPKRLTLWLQACRRLDIMKVTPEYASNNLRLCSKHFTDSSFMNIVQRNSLVWDAVPSIFNFPEASPPRKSPKRKTPKSRVTPAKKRRRVEPVTKVKPNTGKPSVPETGGPSKNSTGRRDITTQTDPDKIGQLQVCVADTQKEKLRQENLQLRQEVERLKNSLVNIEKAQGITQYYDFSKPSMGSGTVNDTPIDLQPSKQPTPPTATATASPPIGKVEKKEASEKKADKKEKKKSDGGEKGGKGKKAEDEGPVDVSRLDFRVGKIVSAKKHPDADTLYVEEVDVGENKMRTVVSGLVRFVPLEEMQNRMAVLLCNLKPAKMRGITSEAMVMCASTPEKVEILTPPVGSQPGDIVQFEGYTRNPDAVLNPKKKIFETCAPDLQTDANKVAVYKGVAFTIPGKGIVMADTLANVQVK